MQVGGRVKARRKQGELQIYTSSKYLGCVKAIHGKGSRRNPKIIHVVFDDGIEEMVPLSRAGQAYVITCNDPPPPPLQTTKEVSKMVGFDNYHSIIISSVVRVRDSFIIMLQIGSGGIMGILMAHQDLEQ